MKNRLIPVLIFSVILFALSIWAQAAAPASLVAVSLYKAHLISLGGWLGYWLDRIVSPYARPNLMVDTATQEAHAAAQATAQEHGPLAYVMGVAAIDKTIEYTLQAALRRSMLIAACVIAVSLGG